MKNQDRRTDVVIDDAQKAIEPKGLLLVLNEAQRPATGGSSVHADSAKTQPLPV